jgi:hypothetical protein
MVRPSAGSERRAKSSLGKSLGAFKPLMRAALLGTSAVTFHVALATFLAACQRWPGTPITLRQGAEALSATAAVMCRH